MWDPKNDTDAQLHDFLARRPLDRMEKGFQDAARQELKRRETLAAATSMAEEGRMVGESKKDVLEVIREKFGEEFASEIAKTLQ